MTPEEPDDLRQRKFQSVSTHKALHWRVDGPMYCVPATPIPKDMMRCPGRRA